MGTDPAAAGASGRRRDTCAQRTTAYPSSNPATAIGTSWLGNGPVGRGAKAAVRTAAPAVAVPATTDDERPGAAARAAPWRFVAARFPRLVWAGTTGDGRDGRTATCGRSATAAAARVTGAEGARDGLAAGRWVAAGGEDACGEW